MRLFRWIVAVMAVVVTLLRIGFYIAKSDVDVGPQITCEKDFFEVKCGDDERDLLKYVSATDPQDGEITDITIERLYFLNDNKSRITFVAVDSDNNIAKITRNIIYTDYTGPRIRMNAPCIYYVTDNSSTYYSFTAEDQFSGDISDRVKLIVESFSRRIAGVYPAAVKVSNYYGTTLVVNFNIYVFPNAFTQSIELSEYIVYLSKGQDKPDFTSYISSSSMNPGQITVDDSQLDLNTPGSYEILYRVGDENNPTAFTRLVAVVGD